MLDHHKVESEAQSRGVPEHNGIPMITVLRKISGPTTVGLRLVVELTLSKNALESSVRIYQLCIKSG